MNLPQFWGTNFPYSEPNPWYQPYDWTDAHTYPIYQDNRGKGKGNQDRAKERGRVVKRVEKVKIGVQKGVKTGILTKGRLVVVTRAKTEMTHEGAVIHDPAVGDPVNAMHAVIWDWT